MALLVLVTLVGMSGCASQGAMGQRPASQASMAPPDLSQDGGGFGPWGARDDFQLLQEAAGLEEDSWHEAGAELETDDARALWAALADTRTTLLNRAEDVPYAELLQRLRPFHSLAVMRPDGYLAGALNGKPLQRMGRLKLRDGRLMAGPFEVGAFYLDKGGVFYPVDDSLRRSGGLLGELGLERDWLNAALDGTEDALAELVLALAHLVTHPVRSIEGLQQLPSAVAALIASSPDYFAHYTARPLQEQIREAARLSTHLLLLYGSAAGTATRITAAGTTLPVLSLSAEGALVVRQLALPVGSSATALGTGASAVYVLMEATKPPDEKLSAAATSRGFKPFTEGNFRENLARLTGQTPEGAHAHHVFPQKLAEKFRDAGINVNDPRFGAWWERSNHLKNTVKYNDDWERFFGRNRPYMHEEILQFGRALGEKYGFKVNF